VRENVCSVLFALKKDILQFLQTKNLEQEFQRELQDMEFICFLAVLADLTSNLNIFNLNLQSKG
jgi:hypothetical protein